MDFGWGWGAGSRLGGRNTRLAITIGLFPLWLIVILAIVSNSIFDPLATDEVRILGVPIGIAILGAIGLLTIAGTLVIWRARSRTDLGVAMALLTMPAAALVILGPAIALIATNLST
jgi:hypothetical protein